MNKRLIIAIDGPSGAGKSSAARLLAERCGYLYLDTGALYRAVAWKVLKEDIRPTEDALERLSRVINIRFQLEVCHPTDLQQHKMSKSGLRIFVDDKDITGEIRREEIGRIASIVSASPYIRRRLLPIQREAAKDRDIVIEGRDIGTEVFPEADLKFYLDASLEVRGRRRWAELRVKNQNIDINTIIKEMKKRDEKDSQRRFAPLKVAKDAILIDTTYLDLDKVVNRMEEEVRRLHI